MKATLVKKEHISNNDCKLDKLPIEITRLHGFSRTSADTVEHTSTHETAVRCGPSSPNHASETHH
jgi:hypothetical protein